MDGKNEPLVLPGDRLAAMSRQSKKVHKFIAGRSLSSRRNSIDPSTDTLFPVTYCGTMPYVNKPINGDTVDSFVKCLSSRNRPSSADKYRKWKKKRSATFTSPKTNGMFRLQSSGSDDVDFSDVHLDEEIDEDRDEDRDDGGLMSKSLSDLDNVETTINPVRSAAHSPSIPFHSLSLATTSLSSRDKTPPDKRRRSDSLGPNQANSTSNLKRKPWSFRSLKKFHSTSSTDKNGSTSSLRGDDSPSSLQKCDSSSLGGSIGSLRETSSDMDTQETPPPKRSNTVPVDKTLPTPAVRVSNLESSGENEDDESLTEQEQGSSDRGQLFYCCCCY